VLGYRPVGPHRSVMDAILSSAIDPTGFRQLLNYLYKVRGSLSVQVIPLTPRRQRYQMPI